MKLGDLLYYITFARDPKPVTVTWIGKQWFKYATTDGRSEGREQLKFVVDCPEANPYPYNRYYVSPSQLRKDVATHMKKDIKDKESTLARAKAWTSAVAIWQADEEKPHGQ